MTEPFFWLAALAGGAFGASIGALNAFAFTGFAVIAGEAAKVAGADATVDITADVAFGPFLGPHVAFAGGAGAAAYVATKRSGEEDGYHLAKSITDGLGTDPDVLAAGAVFGAAGFAFAEASAALSAPYDPVAAGVVASALFHRAALGYSVVGEPSLRLRDGAETWLPYQSSLVGVAFLGAALGLLGGYTAYVTGSAFLAFGLSAATLSLMCAGVENVPVTHHMTLPASTAVVALTGASAGTVSAEAVRSAPNSYVVVIAVAFGVLGAVLGEFAQRISYAGAETHLDPPAASIVATTFTVAVLDIVGILPGSSWVPLPV